MPGTFLVDTGGVIRYVHRNRHQADDPDSQAVLAICRSLG
jgi:peroxiredoxin